MRHPGTVIVVTLATAALAAMAVQEGQQPPSQSEAQLGQRTAPPAEPQRRLFPPQDLILLEAPDREEWQKPDLIMDKLQIAWGDDVADIGAGSGWFTVRLAKRVGENGTVYSQDLQREMVTSIRRRVEREKLRNVRVIQGQDNSLEIPEKVRAILVVDVVPEVASRDRVTFLRNLATALEPNGRIGIVNYKPGEGGPGPEPHLRVDRESVERNAESAGLRVLSRTDLRYQYLIVLGLQTRSQADRDYPDYARPISRQSPGITPAAAAILRRSASTKG
jgi:SAM-dependent methyltransferase